MFRKLRIGRDIFCFLTFLCFLLPSSLRAQTTLVTGTVVDPNGLPYSGAQLKAQLSLAGASVTGQPTVTVSSQAQCISAGAGNAPCQVPFSGTAGPVTLDNSGNIPGGGINLQTNSLITPAGTTWTISVTISPGITPPAGTGPQSFSVALTIAGATQDIGAALNALAPKLGNASSGLPAGLNTQVQFNNLGAFGADSQLAWNSTNKQLIVGTPTSSLGFSAAFAPYLANAATDQITLIPATNAFRSAQTVMFQNSPDNTQASAAISSISYNPYRTNFNNPTLLYQGHVFTSWFDVDSGHTVTTNDNVNVFVNTNVGQSPPNTGASGTFVRTEGILSNIGTVAVGGMFDTTHVNLMSAITGEFSASFDNQIDQGYDFRAEGANTAHTCTTRCAAFFSIDQGSGTGNHWGFYQAGSTPSLFPIVNLTQYLDVTEAGPPGNPPAGIERWFANPSTHVFSCLTSAGGSCAATGSSALSATTAATGPNTINSGDNAQVWNWSLTTSGKSAFTFGENIASTSAGTPFLVNIQTLAASTLNPLVVTARGTANGVQVDAATGSLHAIGTAGLTATTMPYSGLTSFPSACGANQFATQIAATPGCTQPAFSNLSGTATSGQLPATIVYTGQTNVYGAFLQDFTAGTMEIPEAAGFTTNVNSTIGLDTTANIVHFWTNNADSLNVVTTSTTTTTTQALFATAVAGIYNPRAVAAGDLPSIPLNQVISPTGAITAVALANFPWSLTTAVTTDAQDGVAVSEASAATNGTLTNGLANQALVAFTTATNSTAVPLEVVQGSITNTVATPGSQTECTWNNASLVGVCELTNVTDTASAAGSFLRRWQKGNTDQVTIGKVGDVSALGSVSTGSATKLPYCAGASQSCIGGLEGGIATTDTTAATFKLIVDSTQKEARLAVEGTNNYGFLVRSEPNPVSHTGLTAAQGTETLCAAAAGACNVAGQYHIHWNFWGSGTACSSVTAGSVTFLLTWTDENAVTHSAVAMQMMAQTGAATTAMQASFPFQTALANESASGDATISTNGSIIQDATGYTACTTGTGTYNFRASATRIQ
jgi:hypothetical protein